MPVSKPVSVRDLKRLNFFTMIRVLHELKYQSKTGHKIYRNGHFYRSATVYRYVHFLWKAGLIQVDTIMARSGVASSVRRFKLANDGELLLAVGERVFKNLRPEKGIIRRPKEMLDQKYKEPDHGWAG